MIFFKSQRNTHSNFVDEKNFGFYCNKSYLTNSSNPEKLSVWYHLTDIQAFAKISISKLDIWSRNHILWKYQGVSGLEFKYIVTPHYQKHIHTPNSDQATYFCDSAYLSFSSVVSQHIQQFIEHFKPWQITEWTNQNIHTFRWLLEHIKAH